MQFLITSEELKKIQKSASIDDVNRAIGAQPEENRHLISRGLTAINAALFKNGANDVTYFDVFEQRETIDRIIRELLERRCKAAGYCLTWKGVRVGDKIVETNSARITYLLD